MWCELPIREYYDREPSVTGWFTHLELTQIVITAQYYPPPKDPEQHAAQIAAYVAITAGASTFRLHDAMRERWTVEVKVFDGRIPHFYKRYDKAMRNGKRQWVSVDMGEKEIARVNWGRKRVVTTETLYSKEDFVAFVDRIKANPSIVLVLDLI